MFVMLVPEISAPLRVVRTELPFTLHVLVESNVRAAVFMAPL